ncbi:Bax inhibitor-1/YccA family protein [endosymbiont of Pachyrhynchus infernalis]|uniref:Bax inhibitor-1/YccA family protein n=1 Tax=endosymbiont of Pachyrhynchus infernalis TaxID=1971488 RepID=UPI000DC6DF5F|nr:Bax inhibitor-1/YccA family protein [endosymbiont of Pachyrhynchus infernalis]BBA84931.1 inner membrane protein YbhL [endosymbiont of Pachyrhynchus infernalis]
MNEFYNFEDNELSGKISTFKIFITKVYAWMSIGLLITSFVSFYFTKISFLFNLLYNSKLLLLITFFQIILVYLLSNIITILSYKLSIFLFVLYSILNGITMSGIFLIYTFESIFNIFLLTSFIFMFMSIYGFLTKKDLTNLGNLLLMLLLGILLFSIFNIIFKSILLLYLLSYINIIIFTGLIAFDTQKLKDLSNKLYYTNNNKLLYKYSILGALILYLDFINLFLIPIKIFGKKKDEDNYY